MRVLNKKYWPWSIRVEPSELGKMCKWCRDNIGVGCNEWLLYSSGIEEVFAFKDESTVVMFKLKWGEYIK